jgi:CheY-like chemotaxis protein
VVITQSPGLKAASDVALLDVQMPEMDGLTLAAAIKGDPALADTRLTVLTSMGHALRSAELKQFRTTLSENGPTLFESSPRISGLDHINANS